MIPQIILTSHITSFFDPFCFLANEVNQCKFDPEVYLHSLQTINNNLLLDFLFVYLISLQFPSHSEVPWGYYLPLGWHSKYAAKMMTWYYQVIYLNVISNVLVSWLSLLPCCHYFSLRNGTNELSFVFDLF